jgi:hypothetical protein
MKLTIIKEQGGKVRLSFAPTTGTKPIEVVLDDNQVEIAVQLLDSARKMERFNFTLEL